MLTVPIWRTWPSRGWPLTLDEELAFRAELGTPAPLSRVERDDVTHLVTALRCGVEFADLFAFAPGLDPARLAAAYDDLDRRRRAATEAWETLAADPRAAVSHALDASALLPAPVARVLGCAAHHPGETGDCVETVAAEVGHCTAAVHLIEMALADGPPSRRRAAAHQLLAGTDVGYWEDGFYLPRRVTDLSPRRVGDLLGETA